MFVPQTALIPWFDQVWECGAKAMGSEPGDGDPVFATPAGKRLGSVKKSPSELRKAAGLLTDHRSARRTAYPFRHFHISQHQQLIAGVDVAGEARAHGQGAPAGVARQRSRRRLALACDGNSPRPNRLHEVPGCCEFRVGSEVIILKDPLDPPRSVTAD